MGWIRVRGRDSCTCVSGLSWKEFMYEGLAGRDPWLYMGLVYCSCPFLPCISLVFAVPSLSLSPSCCRVFHAYLGLLSSSTIQFRCCVVGLQLSPLSVVAVVKARGTDRMHVCQPVCLPINVCLPPICRYIRDCPPVSFPPYTSLHVISLLPCATSLPFGLVSLLQFCLFASLPSLLFYLLPSFSSLPSVSLPPSFPPCFAVSFFLYCPISSVLPAHSFSTSSALFFPSPISILSSSQSNH